MISAVGAMKASLLWQTSCSGIGALPLAPGLVYKVLNTTASWNAVHGKKGTRELRADAHLLFAGITDCIRLTRSIATRVELLVSASTLYDDGFSDLPRKYPRTGPTIFDRLYQG